MGKAAVSTTDLAATFEGKKCGSGTFTAGEELTVSVTGGGTYMLEVSGGTLSGSGIKCDGTRNAHVGSPESTFKFVPAAGSSEVAVWMGRGTGPTSADMPVQIYAKCKLQKASSTTPSTPSSSTPSPSPSPTSAPTAAPTAKPTATLAPTASSPANYGDGEVIEGATVAFTYCFEANCKFKLTWFADKADDHMDFSIEYAGKAWVGLGISENGKMGPHAIAVITTFEPRLESQLYRLDGRTPLAITSNWLQPPPTHTEASREGSVSKLSTTMPFTDKCVSPSRLNLARSSHSLSRSPLA